MKLKFNKPSNLYVWSDIHLSHKNIIQYSSRPFRDVEAMNQAIHDGISTLPSDAVLFNLGDFSFGGRDTVVKNMETHARALHAKNIKECHFLYGNHDPHLSDALYHLGGWLPLSYTYRSHEYLEVSAGGMNFVLFHYPLESWNHDNHGSYHFFGHRHKDAESDKGCNRLHVGVDTIGFAPISFTEAVNRINKRDAQINLVPPGIESPTASKPE